MDKNKVTRNPGVSEEDKLFNRFTAFISVSLHREKITYFNLLKRQNENIIYDDEMLLLITDENDVAFDMCKNDLLQYIFKHLDKRDRYVLRSRIFEKKKFEEIAISMGLKYKGAAAIYYRAIEKSKKIVEDFYV